MKFLDLMTSVSKKDRFRLMLFLKCMLNTMTYKNFSHFTNLISFSNVIFECIIKSITIIKLFLKKQYLLLNITIGAKKKNVHVNVHVFFVCFLSCYHCCSIYLETIVVIVNCFNLFGNGLFG